MVSLLNVHGMALNMTLTVSLSRMEILLTVDTRPWCPVSGTPNTWQSARQVGDTLLFLNAEQCAATSPEKLKIMKHVHHLNLGWQITLKSWL